LKKRSNLNRHRQIERSVGRALGRSSDRGDRNVAAADDGMGNACRRPKAIEHGDGGGEDDASEGAVRAALKPPSEEKTSRDVDDASVNERPSTSDAEGIYGDGGGDDGGAPVDVGKYYVSAALADASSGNLVDARKKDDGFFDSLEPWYAVAAPMPWTGSTVPSMAPETTEESFYDEDVGKRSYRGMQMYPWEGDAWTAPRVFQIIEHGLACSNVDVGMGRPCTLKMTNEEQIQHLRNAIADVMQTVAFEFALKVFEGAETPEKDACQRFLRRLCEACHGGVYCKLPSLHKTKEACYAHIHDSKHLGAALYTRIFMLRFLKRFPPQHGFRHPEIDSVETHHRVKRDLIEVFDMFKIWRATEAHPGALFGALTTSGMKKMFKLDVKDSWYAVNQMYEVAVAEPSELKSGKLPPMIIDVKGISVTMFTRANIALIAKHFSVAEFHPEPFAHFIVTNTPYLLAALWSIGKMFLTESARNKFVICTGDASAEIKRRYGVEKRNQPVELGGEASGSMRDASDWLGALPQRAALKEFAAIMTSRRERLSKSKQRGIVTDSSGIVTAVPSSPIVASARGGSLHSWPSFDLKFAFKTGVRPQHTGIVALIKAIEIVFLSLLFFLVSRRLIGLFEFTY
jgi:hypothetical protein